MTAATWRSDARDERNRADDRHRHRLPADDGGPLTAGTSVLQLEGITKTFPGVRALTDVDLDVVAGEIHALVGENGAGKSTLMAVASGALAPDATAS